MIRHAAAEWEGSYRALTCSANTIRSPVDFHGEFINLTLDPPRLRPVQGGCPSAFPKQHARSQPRPQTFT